MSTKEFKTLKELINYSSENYANNISFSFIDGDFYTYSQLQQKSDEISRLLSENGIGDYQKVAILSQNMPNWVVAFFSVVSTTRVAVPLLPDFSEHEIKNIIDHSESKVIFVSQRLKYKLTPEILESLDLVICIDTFELIKATENSKPVSVSEPKPEDLASIIYTSGTTGGSKGVMHTHQTLCSHLYAACLLRPGFEWDVWLSLLPLSHTFENSLGMLLPMASGSSVYHIEKAPTPSILLKALKEVRPTTMLSVPLIIEKIYRSSILPKFTSKKSVQKIYKTTLGRKLLNYLAGKKLKETFGGRLRFFGIGGAKLDPEVERFLYEAKFPYGIGYGLTESAPLLAGAVPHMVKWQSTGPVVHGVTLKINNPNPETGEGEIVAKGPNIMVGYYKNPEATKEAFTEDGWFRTKDLGIFDKKGRLYIKGRLNNMILGPSGENIYPEEIESVINAHAMVAESLVTQSKGKLIARIYFNPDKLKALAEAKEEALASYYQTKESFMKSYEEKKEELITSYEEKKEELLHSYDEKKEEMLKAFNQKIEQIKQDITKYVNERVNKFSKISVIIDNKEQFEKTATHKIKRYKYKD